LLKTVSHSWNTSNGCQLSGCTGSAFIQTISETTMLTVPNSGSINSTAQYVYDSIYDMNVTQVSEWKYYTGSLPSTPDRIKSISYLANPGHNIINRPTSITVQNGSQTQTLGQTKITYDSYGSGLVSVTGVAHHDDANYGTGYTARGNPTQIQRLVSGSTYLSTSKTFDTTGQVRSITDPAGNTTSLSYSDNFYNDNGSNPPSAYSPAPTNAYLTQVTLPISGSTSSGYYFGSGKLALRTDQNAATTYQHYLDSLDRLTHQYLPLGWVLKSYPSSTDTEVDTYTSITDTTPSTGCSSCRHDQVFLDGFARPIQNELYNDPDGAAIVATGYDTNGRIGSVSNPYRGSSNGQDTYSYDGIGRTVQVLHADNNSAKSYYGAAVSGNGGISSQLCSASTYGLGYPLLKVDEAGKKRQIWTDGFGKTIEVDEPDNNGNLTLNTCYLYDLLGNLMQVSQGSQTRTYAYDGLSRPTAVTAPETGNNAVNSYYTTSGGSVCSGDPSKVCRRTDPKGVTTTYSYDALNRLTGKSYSDGSTPSSSYSYDSTSCPVQGVSNYGKGRMTGMNDGSGSASWCYDANGRVLAEKRTIAGITKTIQYAYKLDGSVSSVSYPSGRTITYSVGNAQRVLSAVDTGSNIQYALTASYAPQGAISSVIYGKVSGGFGGITEQRSYNNRLEVSAIQVSSSAGGAENLTYNYATANNGNVNSITNNLNTGMNESFAYDLLNRVLSGSTASSSGSGCWGQSFGPSGAPPPGPPEDRYGNLTTINSTQCSSGSLSVTVNASTNQITTSGFAYDSDGNMTQDGSGYTYTYDAENRLTQASGMSGGPWSYTYDGNNLRVKKANAPGGTLYWRSFWGDALAETDLQGNTTNEYVFMAGRRIARRDSSGNVYYYFADALGSPVAITNSSGTPCYVASYTPYGQEMATTNTCPQNYKYTGYEQDGETGLYYAFARYYTPRLGRFLSPDALGGDTSNPQSLNRYAYVANNPLNAIDPRGLCGEGEDVPCIVQETNGGFGGDPGTGQIGDLPVDPNGVDPTPLTPDTPPSSDTGPNAQLTLDFSLNPSDLVGDLPISTEFGYADIVLSQVYANTSGFATGEAELWFFAGSGLAGSMPAVAGAVNTGMLLTEAAVPGSIEFGNDFVQGFSNPGYTPSVGGSLGGMLSNLIRGCGQSSDTGCP